MANQISPVAESDQNGATWRRLCLPFSIVAAGILIAAAFAGLPAVQVAALGAVTLLGGGVALAGLQVRAPDASPRLLASEAPCLPEKARGLLECVDNPVIVLGADQRVLYVNRAAEAAVGQGMVGKHISAVLRTPPVLEAITRVLAGGASEDVYFTFVVPVERDFRAHVARTEAPEDGDMVLIELHDLTDLRRAEEMRADFVANVSHELRTPLAAVSGFIDTLRGHARNDTAARERFLEIMSQESGRMRRLIEDLLSLSRIELNEHNPPAGEVDVVALVHNAAAALAPLAEADAISIVIAPHEPLRAIGDRDELVQVFQNLVHNAIKYGRVGGKVSIGFGQAHAPAKRGAAGQIFIAVADEGEGIPREAIPRLTERFYRVDVKRSRERGGTGLGLAIVKHILNRHSGRLQIESTPGSGSIFTVFLPAA